MISVSFFHVFMVNNWEKCPGGGVLARFIGSGVGVLNSFFGERVGNSPIQKIARGMVRLGIDWYIMGGHHKHTCSLGGHELKFWKLMEGPKKKGCA